MKRLFSLLLLLLVGLMGVQEPVGAEGPSGLLEPIAVYDGVTVTFVRSGDILYVGNGRRVSVYDITDPAHPQHLADSPPLPEVVTGLARTGDWLFAADGPGGLWVFRIQPDGGLTPEQTLLADENVTHVVSEGARVFASGWGPDHQYLTAMEVTDEQVALVSRQEINAGTLAMDVEKDVLYVADHNQFITYDVSDLTAIRELGQYQYGGVEWFLDMKVADRVAYIHAQDTSAGPESSLITVDVSDPAAPEELAFTGLSFIAHRLDLQGPILYITGLQGVHLYDISDPAAPRDAGAYVTPSEALLATPGLLFTADIDRIEITDIQDPAAPSSLSVIPKLGWARFIAVQGTRLFTVGNEGVFRVFDITDIQRPRLLGEDVPPPGSDIQSFIVVDDIVYQAYARYIHGQERNIYALRILDVSDPAQPHEIGRYPLTVMPHRVAYANQRIYLATDIHLLVFDVTQPSRPDLLSLALAANTLDDLNAGDGVLYATTRYIGLSVWDVSDDLLPVTVARLRTPGYGARELARHGDQVIVADGRGGLAFVNVSQPDAPIIETTQPCQYDVQNVAVAGDALFALCRDAYGLNAAIHAFDIRQPFQPVELAAAPIARWRRTSEPTSFHALTAQRDRVFFNGGYAGVQVFRLVPPQQAHHLWLPHLLR